MYNDYEQSVQKNYDEPVLTEVKKKTEAIQDEIEKRDGKRPTYDEAQQLLWKRDVDLFARWRRASYQH